ncbi:MAG: flagellar basal body P-ring formation chaperone FlgA [Chitinivibrionales bacterium]
MRTLIIILLFNTPLLCSTGISLTFIDSVVVDRDSVFLSDIAEIRTESPGGVGDDIANLSVGRSAPPGFMRYFDPVSLVNYRIRPEYPDCRIEIAGAERVAALSDSVSGSVSDYAAEMKRYCLEHTLWKNKETSFRLKNPDEKWVMRREPEGVRVEGIKDESVRGNIRLTLILNNGVESRKFYVLTKLSVKKDVVAVKRSLKRGTRLKESDLKILKKDITDYFTVPYTEVEELKGGVLKRSVSGGTIISERDIKRVMDISKGEPVSIKYVSQDIKISVRGIAREGGDKGDVIWVKNSSSKKIVRAEVTGKGRVSMKRGDEI